MGKQGIKINISKMNSSKSPDRRGRTKSQGDKKRGFPTTPNSIEKQKKLLAGKLKRAMEDNMRLKAHNRCLKDNNQKYMDTFS